MTLKDVFYVDRPWVMVRRNRVLEGDFEYWLDWYFMQACFSLRACLFFRRGMIDVMIVIYLH